MHDHNEIVRCALDACVDRLTERLKMEVTRVVYDDKFVEVVVDAR
jgi:hypothetical protein